MKKIVGILAAAAVLATSVFAADVSAKVRLDGDLFAYDGTATNEKGEAAGAFRMLRTSTQARPYWSPYVTLSTSTDEAGAQILFIEEKEADAGEDDPSDGTRNIKMDRSNVWFKPLDMLTVKVGFQDYKMNVESIDYSPVPTGVEDWGYGISYAQDAFSANVMFVTNNNGWFFEDEIAHYGTKEDPASAYVKDLYFNAAYEADFGKITAMFEYFGKSGTLSEDKTYLTSYTPTKIKFGAGYSNTIDNLSFFADVVGTSVSAMSDKEYDMLSDGAQAAYNAAITAGKTAEEAGEAAKAVFSGNALDKDNKSRSAFGIMVDGFVCYTQDALTVKGYVRFDVEDFGNLNNKGDEDIMYANNTKLGVKARVDYKLDNGINLFAQFNDVNLLQKETKNGDTDPYKSSVFVSEIKLGANGSVGICDWEAKLKIETGANIAAGDGIDKDTCNKYDQVKVSLPVWFQVAF